MKFSYDDHEQISVLTISGDLTIDQVDTFRRACQERFVGGIRDFVINIEHLKLVDSAGLELMLWLADEVADRGGRLKLVKPDETVLKILQITRLKRRFDIDETVELAARGLR